MVGREHLLNLCWASLFWIFRRSTGFTTSDHSGDRVSDEDVPEDQGLPVEDWDCCPSPDCVYVMLSDRRLVRAV